MKHSTQLIVKFWLTSLLFLLIGASTSSNAQAPDSKGRDFWITIPENYQGESTLTLFITGEVSTTGMVSIPGLSFSTNFSVTPGAITSVSLPSNVQLTRSSTIENKGIHITAQQEITAYGLNRIQFTTDAFLALPTDILGTEYINLGYQGGGTQLGIVGTKDGTSVTITPSATTDSHAAGVPYTITLDQGQTYLLRGGNDLSGTIVKSSNPIAVFGSHNCANVPPGYAFCDYLIEQLPPVTAWGKQFVTVPLATRRNGDTFRILASTNNTRVTINGTVVATLNRGQLHELIIDGSSLITANEPVLVAQYSNGGTFDGVVADPFMMLVPPYEQFLGSYTVSTPASGFRTNYINVVAPTAGVGAIMLDGAVIPATMFSTIGSSGFSGAQLPIELGTHNLTGGGFPFGAFVYGFDRDDSYGYPGGQSLAPVATVRTITINLQGGSTATVGTEHCMVATATDQNGNPVAGVRVDFAITGANSQSGFATTNTNGQARFCYTGDDAGMDTIMASSGTVSATSSITWVDKKAQTINFGPIADKNTGDIPFTISATASSGLPVTFTILSGPATISGNTITLTGMEGEVVVQAMQAGNGDYAAASPVIQRFKVVGNSNPVTCANTGGITYEMWANVASTLVEVHQLPAATAPTGTSTLSSFSVPVNAGDNYFARVRGYLCVPATGMYRFHLSADDRAALWLSTDEDPANKAKVAFQQRASSPGVYNMYPSQQSGMIQLVAGQRYYIEAVMREFRYGDHMTVAWTRPDGVMETIPGANLVPYTSTSTMASMRAETNPVAAETTLDAFAASPNPFTDKMTINFSVVREEDVRLEIYSLQGQLVKALHLGKAQAGKAYSYEFTAGMHANGVYICRMTVAGKTTVKRLLLDR